LGVPDADDKSSSGDRKVNPRRESEGALARLARHQDGVVSREQLFELGFSYQQIEWRVEHGRLHLIHHNVYAVGHRSLADHAHLVAALLSAGPTSFLSHRTSGAAYGVRVVNLRQLEVTVPGGTSRRRGTLIVHRSRHEPDADDVRVRGGLRISSYARMLVELAPHETPAELDRLITAGVRKRLLRLDTADGLAKVEATLARHPRHAGLSRLAAALSAYRRTDSSKSELERAFDRFLAQHPEIPDPQRNIHIDRWEIDRCWPAHHLVVELDGRPYHVAARDMERDRIKDAALQRLGYHPLRFTDFRFDHDLPGILRDLRHFLGLEEAA
jgi:very-short-patch-repair endonuclease